jgi:tetratricopeptide (TPR) repeat protein
VNQEHERVPDELLSYLEDDLLPEAKAAFEARLAQNAGLREELAELRAIAGELATLGDTRRAAVPQVDLLSGVLIRVQQHEARLDAQGGYEDIEQMLYDTGDTQRALTPEVDLLPGVLLKVREHANSAGIPAEESALLDAFDDAYTSGGAATLADVSVEPMLAQTAKAYRELFEDLDNLGAQRAAQVPTIDITQDVLGRVRELAALKNVVPLQRNPRPLTTAMPPRKRATWWRVVVPLATAAALAIALWPALQRMMPAETPTDLLAQNDGQFDPLQPDDSPLNELPLFTPNAADQGDSVDETGVDEAASSTPSKALTAQEILNQKRAQLFGPESVKNRLDVLASLTQDQARNLIATQDLDLAALLGAVKFLPREEAIAVLLDQLKNNPDNPYLRYALANEMGIDPAARDQLAAWSQLDPGNALPFYMDARILLEQGDLEGALALLQQASALEQAYPYSLLNAQSHEQALLASGMDADAARLLAATTGGTQEYSDLSGLAQQMLQYGEYYEGLGDYETAQALYNAAHNFGLQMDQGASFANERLAALETQQSALGSLQGLYEILGNEENVQVMLDSLQILTLGLNELYQVFDQQNQLFNGTDLSAILTIAGTILLSGDLNLF